MNLTPTSSFRPLASVVKPFILVLLVALPMVVVAILIIRSLQVPDEPLIETAGETALPQAFQFYAPGTTTPLPTTASTTPLLSATIPPTPTPAPLPHGAQNFSVSNSNLGPKFSKGTLDPYDPAIGEAQTVTITIRDTNPVTNAEVTIKTDTASQTYPLTLSSGTNLDGAWKGTWTASDTYLRTYHLILTAKSDTGTSMVDITLR